MESDENENYEDRKLMVIIVIPKNSAVTHSHAHIHTIMCTSTNIQHHIKTHHITSHHITPLPPAHPTLHHTTPPQRNTTHHITSLHTTLNILNTPTYHAMNDKYRTFNMSYPVYIWKYVPA
jgi:hypothetical protein